MMGYKIKQLFTQGITFYYLKPSVKFELNAIETSSFFKIN